MLICYAPASNGVVKLGDCIYCNPINRSHVAVNLPKLRKGPTAKEEEHKRKGMKMKMKKNKEAADAAEEEEDYGIGKEKKKDKNKKKKQSEKGIGNDGIDNKKQEKRSSSSKSGGNLITDPRFSAVHSDPRFQRLPKHHSKVTIDSRFRSVFSHKDFSSAAPFDKRGKPKKVHPKEHPLRHYYRQEGDAAADGEDDAEGANVAALSSASSSSSDSEVSVDEAYASSSSSDDSIEEDDDIEELQNAAFDVDPKNIFQEDIPTIEQETHRLAIVNLDWKYVKAVDLYVLLSSCLPKDGQILSVAIYPSEFGLKRMEEEALNGPMALFDGENKNDEEEEEEEDNDDDDDYKERLREYERSTLRYYFAVVECDSIATADYLYKTCDGIELERSSNVLDLRFIPDSMEFKHPHDIATEAPANYQTLDFHTPALQRTNIQLSWDEDEPQRKILKRKLNSEQLAKMDLKEFLASDDDRSSSDNDDEDDDRNEAMPDRKSHKLKKVDMYRSLVQSGDGSDADEENNKDMEVTFNTGLEDISKRILEKKDKKSETVWEAYLRKRREKKKGRKRNSKDSSEDDGSDDSDVEVPEGPDDFFVEESSDTVKAAENSWEGTHKKSDRKKNLKHRKPSLEAVNEQEASRAELELLLADDQGGDHLKGYNLKSKKHKGKKGKETLDDDSIPSIADDPRFSVVFSSPLFALDPTDPQFKRSAAYMRQLRQKHKGSEKERKEGKEMLPPKHEQFSSDDVSYKNNDSLKSNRTLLKNDKHELSSLVRRVKRRAGSLQS
ncbi:hypothetical protein ACLOJK_033675 [Asimina triloba]